MIQQPAPPADNAPGETLAPPRPNLGPEPLPAEGSLSLLIPVLLGGLLILAAVVIAWRRRRRSADPITQTRGIPRDDSPEARLLALRERARAILTRRFGPALRARTTEEVAADPRLAETLGGDDLAKLTNLLRAGDRILFDREAASGRDGDLSADLERWTALLDALSRSR